VVVTNQGSGERSRTCWLAVVLVLAPHPAQMHRLSRHRHLRDLPPTSHGQVEELGAPGRLAALRTVTWTASTSRKRSSPSRVRRWQALLWKLISADLNGPKPLKEMAPQVGRCSQDTPIFSVLKVKQLRRRRQGKFHFPIVIELSEHSISIRKPAKH